MPRSMRRIVLNQREEGFTLVELIVAMLIIGIVLVSVATVQVGTLQTNADNAARNTATALANGAMEQFRSLPWNVLRKGMASNYLVASGGDSSVSVTGVLQVNNTNHTILVAPSGASDQNLAKNWLPLFSPTGSHIQVINDPEGNGNVYRVKAYVTNPDGGTVGAIGLAVVVEWQRPGSAVIHYTSIFSSAYAPSGGCGSLDAAPFLTSCQPQYASAATTASTTVAVSAYEYDTGTGEVGDALPVVPGETSGGVNTAGSQARAESDSAQNTAVSAAVEHAVSSVTSLSDPDAVMIVGGTPSLALQASDNTVDPDAPLANPTPLSGSGDSASTAIGVGGNTVSVDGDGLGGAVTASTTNACAIASGSLPAHQPCAVARINATGSALGATWQFGGKELDLVTGNGIAADVSRAWVARFRLGYPSGSATVGCAALSGAGCVSAYARAVDPTINVGKMVTSGWIGSKAPKGLVEIVGYNDSVLVERGAAQSTTAAAITRAATINYWNGTAYTPLSVISTTPDTTRTTGVVTYADANVTLTASATVSVSAPIAKTSGANCAVDRCRVQGDAGLISVTLKIVVVPASGTPYLLETVLLINGSTAYAQFTEPVDV